MNLVTYLLSLINISPRPVKSHCALISGNLMQILAKNRYDGLLPLFSIESSVVAGTPISLQNCVLDISKYSRILFIRFCTLNCGFS